MILRSPGFPSYIKSILGSQCLDGGRFYEKNVERKYWQHEEIMNAWRFNGVKEWNTKCRPKGKWSQE